MPKSSVYSSHGVAGGSDRPRHKVSRISNFQYTDLYIYISLYLTTHGRIYIDTSMYVFAYMSICLYL